MSNEKFYTYTFSYKVTPIDNNILYETCLTYNATQSWYRDKILAINLDDRVIFHNYGGKYHNFNSLVVDIRKIHDLAYLQFISHLPSPIPISDIGEGVEIDLKINFNHSELKEKK